MDITLFGFEFGKKKSQEELNNQEVLSGPKRLIAREEFDGTVAVEAGGVYGTFVDYSSSLKDENANIVPYQKAEHL